MILVTGATGKIGRRVVDELVESGHDVRALVRDRAHAGLPPGVELVEGDLRDPASVEPALGGVDAVFLLWALGQFEPAPAVVAAIERRARRIVYLSAIADAIGRPLRLESLTREEARPRCSSSWATRPPSTGCSTPGRA